MPIPKYFKHFLWSIIFFACLCYTKPATALLPPYYESAKEITAILNDPNISKIITSGRLIHAITKMEDNTGYIVSTGTCTLHIKVIYSPPAPGFVGPAVFELQPGALVCKK